MGVPFPPPGLVFSRVGIEENEPADPGWRVAEEAEPQWLVVGLPPPASRALSQPSRSAPGPVGFYAEAFILFYFFLKLCQVG